MTRTSYTDEPRRLCMLVAGHSIETRDALNRWIQSDIFSLCVLCERMATNRESSSPPETRSKSGSNETLARPIPSSSERRRRGGDEEQEEETKFVHVPMIDVDHRAALIRDYWVRCRILAHTYMKARAKTLRCMNPIRYMEILTNVAGNSSGIVSLIGNVKVGTIIGVVLTTASLLFKGCLGTLNKDNVVEQYYKTAISYAKLADDMELFMSGPHTASEIDRMAGKFVREFQSVYQSAPPFNYRDILDAAREFDETGAQRYWNEQLDISYTSTKPVTPSDNSQHTDGAAVTSQKKQKSGLKLATEMARHRRPRKHRSTKANALHTLKQMSGD